MGAAEKFGIAQELFKDCVSDENRDAIEQAYHGNVGSLPTMKPEIEYGILLLHNAHQQVRLCQLITPSATIKISVLKHLFAGWVTTRTSETRPH